jgi:hypothetical protein
VSLSHHTAIIADLRFAAVFADIYSKSTAG